MDAELIEKVARAMYVVERSSFPWVDEEDSVQDAWRALARAAIAALSATPQAAQVAEGAVTRLAIYLAEKDGHDPHALIMEGYPPEPWGEAWNRYEPDARAMLAAAQAQGCAMAAALANYESIAEAYYSREAAAQAQEPNT